MRTLASAISLVLGIAFIPTNVLAQQVERGDRAILDMVRTLKPGQYVWAPELSGDGPALVVVNLGTQRLVLFRNGVPVAASTVSSGSKGHETPTGVFNILQKNKEHYSKTYNNAPMPNMQRLTTRGIALHAGNLPGYPASHGCVRLPLAFSKLLFGGHQCRDDSCDHEHPGCATHIQWPRSYAGSGRCRTAGFFESGALRMESSSSGTG